MDDSIASLLIIIAISVGVSVVTFWGLGGLVHVAYYKRRRDRAHEWKLQPKRFLKDDLVRHSFKLGGFNIIIGGIVGGTFSWHVVNGGWSTLYFDLARWPDAPGGMVTNLVWLPISALLCYAMIDAGLYYSHRFMHNKWIFKYIHRWHHRYTAPVIFTTTATHPLEFLVFQFFVMLPVVVVPMHWSVYLVVVLYTYLIGMIDHCGIKVQWPLPFHTGNRFHDDHHVYFHCNYGHHTQLWDRLHGTLRQENRRYGEHVFGGKGAPLKSKAKAKSSKSDLDSAASAAQ